VSLLVMVSLAKLLLDSHKNIRATKI